MSTETSIKSSEGAKPSRYFEVFTALSVTSIVALVIVSIALAIVVQSYVTKLSALRSEFKRVQLGARIAEGVHHEQCELLVARTEELHNVVKERDALKIQNRNLAEQVARDNEAFRYTGLNPNSDYKKVAPAGIEGAVTAAGRPDMIEISLGSDDGLRIGHQLEVVRTNSHKYVGRIDVVKLTPNRAICRPNASNQVTAIEVGDHVYGSLNQIK